MEKDIACFCKKKTIKKLLYLKLSIRVYKQNVFPFSYFDLHT